MESGLEAMLANVSFNWFQIESIIENREWRVHKESTHGLKLQVTSSALSTVGLVAEDQLH